MERRAILERILKPFAGVQRGNYLEREGTALFNITKEKGMEGIVAKRKDSIYRPGKRTSDWLKIKSHPQQEFVGCLPRVDAGRRVTADDFSRLASR
jgi:bifunctional non-homologous end joining protein LigD